MMHVSKVKCILFLSAWSDVFLWDLYKTNLIERHSVSHYWYSCDEYHSGNKVLWDIDQWRKEFLFLGTLCEYFDHHTREFFQCNNEHENVLVVHFECTRLELLCLCAVKTTILWSCVQITSQMNKCHWQVDCTIHLAQHQPLKNTPGERERIWMQHINEYILEKHTKEW